VPGMATLGRDGLHRPKLRLPPSVKGSEGPAKKLFDTGADRC